MSSKQALLLIGSPKGKKSTSESLGTHVLNGLKNKGWEVDTEFIHRALKTEEGRDKLLSQVNTADTIVLAFPLYVDSLPAPVIEALEIILENRPGTAKEQGLLVLLNSGFPEPDHNRIAKTNCKIFAKQAGMKWLGGLTIGGGAAISGRSIKEVGGMARKVAKALDLTIEAVNNGKKVPKEALVLTSKPMVPKWLYLFFGNRGWKSSAKKNGAKEKLYDVPYAKDR